ncbi:MAG: NUDIX hydrolase [Elusimicrobia bacterium]|nr:NUDIX hydrolase [Candidatus Obscuribacterium magneticum]
MSEILKTMVDGPGWQKGARRIKRCYVCGHALASRTVREEGRRRLVCRACGEITYVNPKVVCAVIPVLSDGRLVLLKRKIEPGRGLWSYPAGFMEMKETVVEAARREAAEEIGVKVNVGDMIGVYSYRDAGVVTIVFEGKVPKGQRPRAGEEADEVKLFKIEDIPWKKLAFRSTVHGLRDWQLQRRHSGESRNPVRCSPPGFRLSPE